MRELGVASVAHLIVGGYNRRFAGFALALIYLKIESKPGPANVLEKIALKSDQFPDEFDPSRCILFLGAGFSAGAKNKKGTSPPVGNGLNSAIKMLANIPEDDSSDLIDTAGYAISQGLDLYNLLETLFTVRVLSEDQCRILSLPWMRIYTTNYDNSVSVYKAEKNGDTSKEVYDLTDAPPKQLRRGSVIHLHGSIAKCQKESLDATLVLTRRSFVEQRVKKSPWWEWFDRDVKVAQHIFFLGYEINDFEPASYLAKYPGMEARRHFVLRTPNSPIAASKLEGFGIRHSFELSGFVERLSRARADVAPAHEKELTSFHYVDLLKDNKLSSKPTSAEVQELLAFGRIRIDAVRSTLPESEYVVFRKSALDLCKEKISVNRTLVIHSKIGNGKSVLVEQLKVILSQNGFRCFALRDGISPHSRDIEYLTSINKLAIFFPNYDSAIANAHLFDSLSDSARFIVELPTSTLQVRLQEVNHRLQGSVGRVCVDNLDKSDVSSLQKLLSRAGLTSLAKSPKLRDGIEFRDFLLMSYEDPEIAVRLKSVIGPLLQSSAARKIVCASSILKSSGASVDVGFIENVTGEDPYVVLTGLGEAALDLMAYSMDKLEPYSSVLSEHILKKYIDARDFVQTIFDLAAEAARRISDTHDYSSVRFRCARAILSSVIRFGFVESMLGPGADKRKMIGNLYEKCRRDILMEKEPLFWLQYSIYWQNESRWDLAESHMIEAYARGEERPEFRTFQLDTNYFGLLCDLERHSLVGEPVSRFEKLIELMGKCRSMIDSGNHRDHVIRAFLKIEPMLLKKKADFTKEQSVTFVYNLHLAVQKFNGLSTIDKHLFGSEPCRHSLSKCISIVTS